MKDWLITLNEAEAETLCDHPIPHADRESAIEAARHLVSEGVDVAVGVTGGVGVLTEEFLRVYPHHLGHVRRFHLHGQAVEARRHRCRHRHLELLFGD